jgi:hypothetical protein
MIVMTVDQISEYEAQLSQLNTQLEPLGKRIYERMPESPPRPLDELGVRTEAMRLMTLVSELYASAPESRARIRDIFERYQSVRSAL